MINNSNLHHVHKWFTIHFNIWFLQYLGFEWAYLIFNIFCKNDITWNMEIAIHFPFCSLLTSLYHELACSCIAELEGDQQPILSRSLKAWWNAWYVVPVLNYFLSIFMQLDKVQRHEKTQHTFPSFLLTIFLCVVHAPDHVCVGEKQASIVI